MVSTLVTLLLMTSPPPAVDMLTEVRSHYQNLNTFAMTIEHQNSSGLFPGKYAQTLRWRKGGRFELLVTRPNPDAQAYKAPDYYANGKEILLVFPGNRWET